MRGRGRTFACRTSSPRRVRGLARRGARCPYAGPSVRADAPPAPSCRRCGEDQPRPQGHGQDDQERARGHHYQRRRHHPLQDGGSPRPWALRRPATAATGSPAVLQVLHPAARMLVELSKSQDVAAGDGTTTVVVIAGALLNACRQLLEKGIHPVAISESFQLAVTEAEKILTEAAIPVRCSAPGVQARRSAPAHPRRRHNCRSSSATGTSSSRPPSPPCRPRSCRRTRSCWLPSPSTPSSASSTP